MDLNYLRMISSFQLHKQHCPWRLIQTYAKITACSPSTQKQATGFMGFVVFAAYLLIIRSIVVVGMD